MDNVYSNRVATVETEGHSKYDQIVLSQDFQQLLAEKRKFVIPYVIFFTVYSLILPFLALYADVMNKEVVGGITWAWIYGISFIPVSLLICTRYTKKAAYFDEKVKKLLGNGGK